MAEPLTVRVGDAADAATLLNKYRQRCHETKTLVELKLVYVRYISDLDTLNQKFSAAFGLDMLWPATKEEEARFAKDPSTYEADLQPNFEFPNAKSGITLERRVLASGSPFKVVNGKNFLRTLVTGDFSSPFDLRAYPFDVQTLKVTCDLSFDLKESMLFTPWLESWSLDDDAIRSGKKNFVQLNRAFSSIPDFDICRVLIETAVREDCWAQFTLQIQVARKPWGALGRLASLCFLIGLSTLTLFAMDPADNLSDRLNFLITGALAFVAFTLIVSSQLPMTPYLTLLDKFTMRSLAFLILLMCVVAVMHRAIPDPGELREADDRLFFASIAGYALLNIVFMLEASYLHRREMKKLSMSVTELRKLESGQALTPLNVYGDQMLPECERLKDGEGDPFVTFAGSNNKAGNYFA